MVLWLPYFFVKIGYHRGALLSLIYPLGYILSPFVFQPLQKVFKNHIGQLFLVLLFLDLAAAIILCRLNGDK